MHDYNEEIRRTLLFLRRFFLKCSEISLFVLAGKCDDVTDMTVADMRQICWTLRNVPVNTLRLGMQLCDVKKRLVIITFYLKSLIVCWESVILCNIQSILASVFSRSWSMSTRKGSYWELNIVRERIWVSFQSCKWKWKMGDRLNVEQKRINGCLCWTKI